MKNIPFKEVNLEVSLSKPNLHYTALRTDDYMVFCFKMNWKERLKAFFTGKIWVGKIAPINEHLQPFVLTPYKDRLIYTINERDTEKVMAELTR